MTPRELENITFGIEMECLAPSDADGNATFANGIGGYHNGRQIEWLPRGWNSQDDGSIRGDTIPAGFTSVEVVSPKLAGSAGLLEAVAACEELVRRGFRVKSEARRAIRVLGWIAGNHVAVPFGLLGAGPDKKAMIAELYRLANKFDDAAGTRFPAEQQINIGGAVAAV